MIIRLRCPNCENDSYAPSVEEFRVCPYCGIVYSGRYGIDRRKEKRSDKEMPVDLYSGQKRVDAYLKNIAKCGICLKILGKYQFREGEKVILKIGNLDKKARIVWVKTIPKIKQTMAGLKIEEENIAE